MEKKNIFIGNIVIVGVVVIVLLFAAMVSKEKNVEKNIRIHNISFAEYKEKALSDEFSIFLIGRGTCSHCVEYKPLVNQVASKYNLDVYYISLDNIEYEDYVYLHDDVGVLKNQFDEEKNPMIPTPVTVIYRSGHEVDSVLGNVRQEGFLDLLVKNGVVKK